MCPAMSTEYKHTDQPEPDGISPLNVRNDLRVCAWINRKGTPFNASPISVTIERAQQGVTTGYI